MKRAALAVFVLPMVLALPAAASARTQPAGSVRLTDGRTFAHWAQAEHRGAVRRSPSPSSRRVARLHFLTEDRYPEVYPALRRFTDRDGRGWIRIRIPRRPNGGTGWVRDTALGPLYVVRTRLLVDRRRLRATLYRAGRKIWRARIGIGKRATPTPAGHFGIREKFRVKKPGGIFGSRAFGTGGYSVLSDWPGGGIVGIHGTNEPRLIPGRPSHGCVRLRNRDVRRLFRLMPIGTPVRIR
jgi:L,D-transpeptidase catalytic domain